MAREIKFRGKRVDNGEWVTGLLTKAKEENNLFSYFILRESNWENLKKNIFEILPETIGCYTGLKDANGVEIYEGDILSNKWKLEVYQNDEGTFMAKYHTNPKQNKPISLKSYLKRREMAKTIETDNVIIGNIYENPELLA